MQTSFSDAQLADPHMRESEKILRTCVHCGFCTATCPTYLLLGDELDSPRGRRAGAVDRHWPGHGGSGALRIISADTVRAQHLLAGVHGGWRIDRDRD